VASTDRGESALIVPVELPAELARLRNGLDPSAGAGVPAHITLLYPFVPPDRLDESVFAPVAEIARAVEAFSFTLGRVQRWPDVVCLLPEPSRPFSRLIVDLASAFPNYPPYSGEHALADIVPHVTIAQSARAEDLDAASVALPGLLPVHAQFEEIRLIAHHPGQLWRTVWSYRLPIISGG
jgi:2'-5' RNA ligase